LQRLPSTLEDERRLDDLEMRKDLSGEDIVSSGWRTGQSYGIFLSHSADDSHLVLGIKAQLGALGVAVYLYEEHAEPGRSIPDKLQEAIRQCDALVALLTPASATRSFVHDEIGYALGLGITAVALVTPGVTPEKLGMLQGEYIPLDPSNPLIGMAELTRFLNEQARQRLAAQERRQAEVVAREQELVRQEKKRQTDELL
jgi:nucleoside 2-deoxyribosyltransferase